MLKGRRKSGDNYPSAVLYDKALNAIFEARHFQTGGEEPSNRKKLAANVREGAEAFAAEVDDDSNTH